MKVSIIGAGRNRNGIGKYIANYFQRHQASVVAVLGTSEKTAHSAANGLKPYGIDAAAYTNFDRMIHEEKLDAVVIASPLETHYGYLVKSIESGLNIFCEKPFFWQEKEDLTELLDTLFQMAGHKNVTIAMNSQWPFSLPFYEKLCGSVDAQKIDSFFIRLSPACAGKEMILESVPHALSILYFIFGSGKISDSSTQRSAGKTILRFRYRSEHHDCKVTIQLAREKSQPRSFKFGFNDKIVNRVVDFENYDIYFAYGNKDIKITDPLELSVKDFIASVERQREPLIGKSHIVATTRLLKIIYNGCEMV
jgi:hypothetical protein